MRKTAFLVLRTPLTSQEILGKLQPLGDNLLAASIATKPGEADILVIHYDDDDGRISDDYILGLV